jgi:hypothetical protein
VWRATPRVHRNPDAPVASGPPWLDHIEVAPVKTESALPWGIADLRQQILFFDELLKAGKIIDPRDSANVNEHAYFNSLAPEQQDTLKYLIRLDGWFAIIIYPH